jgi:hypothetical protein
LSVSIEAALETKTILPLILHSPPEIRGNGRRLPPERSMYFEGIFCYARRRRQRRGSRIAVRVGLSGQGLARGARFPKGIWKVR